MEKVVRVFRSFEEADRANRAEYRRMTPEQRLDVMLEIIRAYTSDLDEASQGLARVYRVFKRRRR